VDDTGGIGVFGATGLLATLGADNVEEQNFLLSQAINANPSGQIEIYLDRYLSAMDGTTRTIQTRDALVDTIAKTVAHEIGHELGIVHSDDAQNRTLMAGGQIVPGSTVDVMAQGFDLTGQDTIRVSAPLWTVALGLGWDSETAQAAIGYFQAYQLGNVDNNGAPADDVANDSSRDAYGPANSDAPPPYNAASLYASDPTTGLITTSLDFGSVPVDPTGAGAKTRTLILSNYGDQPLRIASVGFAPSSAVGFLVAGVAPNTILAPGASVTLNIIYDPRSAGDQSATLVITNDGVGSTLDIAVHALGQSATGHAVLTVPNNNLGGTELGGTPNRTTGFATLTNDGATPLTVYSIRVSSDSGEFAVGGLPLALASGQSYELSPGGELSFDVAFLATAAGLRHGTISIFTDDPTRPQLTIPLVGTGIGDNAGQAGNDYVAAQSLTGVLIGRTISGPDGNWTLAAPPGLPVEVIMYDPTTNLVCSQYEVVGSSGQLLADEFPVFVASTAPDSDGDGIPDDIELALGTNPNVPDSGSKLSVAMGSFPVSSSTPGTGNSTGASSSGTGSSNASTSGAAGQPNADPNSNGNGASTPSDSANGNPGTLSPSDAPAAPAPHVGLLNGGFSDTTPTDANFGWTLRGNVVLSGQQAVLGEGGTLFAGLSQSFSLGTTGEHLQFTLDASQLRDNGGGPPDAFELALLDPTTLTSLLGTASGLNNTDALLNFQSDGQVFYSPLIHIAGLNTSGGVLPLNAPIVVDLDLSSLPIGQAATVYFDLLGFGPATSSVAVSGVSVAGALPPPTANAGGNATGDEGSPIVLQGTFTSPDSKPLLTWHVVDSIGNDVGDGVGRAVSFTPPDNGTYTATFTVTDADGQSASDVAIVTVNNVPPVPSISFLPASPVEGSAIDLTGSATDVSPIDTAAGFTFAWTVTVGGVTLSSGAGDSLDFTPPDNGLYVVTLSATDKDGGVGTAVQNITVANVPPTVILPPSIGTQANVPFFQGGSFTDPGADTWTATVDYGDGLGAQPLSLNADKTFTLSHSYASGGTYAVTVTVTDKDGGVGTATTNVAVTGVVGRYLFYNDSFFDNYGLGASAADDGAIATDKQALLPGQTATFANYSSYSNGLNGVMVDIAHVPSATLSAADFTFKVGNSNTPGSWANAPAPLSITVRKGAGAGGSDRIEIIWANNAIAKQWLQITILANSDTGVAAADVFYFGNEVGETGNSTTDANVDSSDETRERLNFSSTASVTNPFDLNRDGRVDAADQLLAHNNRSYFTPLKLITVPAAPAMMTMSLAMASAAPAAASASSTSAASAVKTSVATVKASTPPLASKPAPAVKTASTGITRIAPPPRKPVEKSAAASTIAHAAATPVHSSKPSNVFSSAGVTHAVAADQVLAAKLVIVPTASSAPATTTAPTPAKSVRSSGQFATNLISSASGKSPIVAPPVLAGNLQKKAQKPSPPAGR
jgi:hypothetical protein